MVDVKRVDLDELRMEMGAASGVWEYGDPHFLLAAKDEITKAARAVVEAPRVWWCEHENEYTPAVDVGVDTTCADDDERGPWHARCGWLALVPVEEE